VIKKIKAFWSCYRCHGGYAVLERLSAYRYLPKSLFSFATKDVLTLKEVNRQAIKRALVGYDFRSADASSIDDLVACQGARVETPAAVFERFFEQGAHCYVVRKDNVTVAYFWVFSGEYLLSFAETRRERVTFALRADERFFGNGYIAPAYRLKGLFPYLVKFVMDQYPAGTKFFSSVNALNAASIKAHLRFGFIPLFRLTCVGLLSTPLFFRSSGDARFRVFLGSGPAHIDLSNTLVPASVPALDA
jgi:hypothetical protein